MKEMDCIGKRIQGCNADEEYHADNRAADEDIRHICYESGEQIDHRSRITKSPRFG